MTELAPKGPRFVEIIEIMDRLDIPLLSNLTAFAKFFIELAGTKYVTFETEIDEYCFELNSIWHLIILFQK